MATITCIEDFKPIFKRRVPKMFYDYVESGSYTEQTFRENTSDFNDIRFRQRVAVDIDGRSTAATMLGQPVAMPVGLCPVGSTGMQHPDGEIKAARAAGNFGVPYTLSTMSVCSMEDVAKHQPHPFWFQLYVMRDQDFVDRAIQRAKDVGCTALVLTLDLQILGQRHKDIKNGLTVPLRPTIHNIGNLATKWRWLAGMAMTPRRQFGNIVGHAKDVTDVNSLMTWTNEQFDPHLDWKKVERIRDQWGGKLILKGIQDPEDAKMAAKIGADAMTVSNHGGRQLDGAISAIRALPGVLEAVDGKTEVWIDSGIRSGQDVLKALALGAKAAMIGRSYIYGLGAMGEAGVTKALEVIQKEMDITMALCGRKTIDLVTRDMIQVPKGFAGDWA